MFEFTFQVMYANNGYQEYITEREKVKANGEKEAYLAVLAKITRSDIRSINIIDIYQWDDN